ncbi:MAG: Zn-ribbon domain-containing OB-fold protein [Planctomycetes bacterium]|nr:Zn-ribbon domain-containing OB-fold protein [Planctomycetota bacterium]
MSTANSWRESPQRYRLEANKCKKSGKIFYPPRLICDECGGREFEKVTLPFTGKLVTYTVIRTPPSEFSDLAPYALGIVELDNGVRTHCQIADCDFDQLKVGLPVKMEFRRIQEDGEAGMIHYGHKAVPQQ